MPVTETLDTTALIELEYARNFVKKGDDEDVVLNINAASLVIENFLQGTVLIQRSFTEDYSAGAVESVLGGSKRIWLRHGPLSSVTSITDDNSDTIAATDYTAVTNDAVSYLEHDSTWPTPLGRWTIVYTAGYFSGRSAVTADIRRACALEVKRLAEGTTISGLGSGSLSGRAGSRSRTNVKAQAMNSNLLPYTRELLAPYVRQAIF